ncbi:hypothetical protein E3Q23_02728 [Wallemia mellicola]|uniref:Kinesin-domain-containing protein n=1 Tax=Wallemia mellicola TaxID=1708541 RepID=A0A4T0TGJ4_9BASI|nr:hypothetical protein E3Q23_02728 [Wallemia mellicola]TIC53482.1 kinesin-domain-containing protein [Wallemia mellicola]TIC64140.1 kinesin-domain-containing protein [Wallemia mellicola]
MASKNNNIQVAVRCRPLKPGENQILSTEALRGQSVTIDSTHSTTTQKTYTFDHVFGDHSDQAMVYADVGAPIVDEMLQGFNCTIFAYGMTGTGKTYTMAMDEKDTLDKDRGDISDGAGIIPRALHSIFNKLEHAKAECSVRVSYIELYNEELRDLLSLNYKPPSVASEGLKMFGDPKGRGGVIIQGLEETLVDSAEMAFEAFERGSRRRKIASTNCNEYSSRSHSVFTITVHIKDFSERGDEIVRIGKLNLVDLAGSENIGRSGAVDMRAREAGNINASLLALGRVINGLVERSDKNRNKKLSDKAADKSYIPYRDSKLTRLLQDSLGGETKTFIIATISPSKASIEETLSTLDYALRAKSIENKPQVQQKSSKNMYINDLVAENVRLKAEFRASVEQNNGMWFTKDKVHQFEYLQENKEKCDKEREGFVATEREHLHTLQKLDLADNEIIIKRNTIAKLEKELEVVKKELEEERVVGGVRAHGEKVNYAAASSWLDHARSGQRELEQMHGILNEKTAQEEADKTLLRNYHSDATATIKDCSTKAQAYTTFVDRVLSDVQSQKSQFVQSLEGIPILAKSTLGDIAAKMQDAISHLSKMESDNGTESVASTDAIQRAGENVNLTLQTVVKDLDAASARFSEALTEVLTKEMNGFDGKIDELFGEYRASSEKRIVSMEDDVVKLGELYSNLEEYAKETTVALENNKAKLEAYHNSQTTSALRRSERLVGEVTRIVDAMREEELASLSSIPPVATSLGELHSIAGTSREKNLAIVDELTLNSSNHAQATRDEVTKQQSAWQSVKAALRDVKKGVDGALTDNKVIVQQTHVKLMEGGKADVEAIVAACDCTRARISTFHETYDRLSRETTSNTARAFDSLASDLHGLQEDLAKQTSTLVTLTEDSTSSSQNHSIEMVDILCKIESALEDYSKGVHSGAEASIPAKREWIGEMTYEMQVGRTREEVLEGVMGVPPKRSRSFDEQMHQPHVDERQGSAPPEMSPRKEAYTVEAVKPPPFANTLRSLEREVFKESQDLEMKDEAKEEVKDTESKDMKDSTNTSTSTLDTTKNKPTTRVRRAPLRATSANIPRTRSSAQPREVKRRTVRQ